MIHIAKEMKDFATDVVRRRVMIFELTKSDFYSKYISSYLGITWAFVQPSIMILVFWFVFAFGFRVAPVSNDVPFIIWLLAGMIPWFFIAECLNTGTNSVVDYTFVIKKINFPLYILPIIKILSALVIHSFFIILMLVVFLFYKMSLSLYALQIFYYLFCSIVLLLGISWLTSAVALIMKDMSQIIAMVVQLGFWATPIFWNINMIPAKYHFIIKLNPAYYITQGYRDSLINNVWFFDKPQEMLVFWGVALGFFIMGLMVFKELRQVFADYI